MALKKRTKKEKEEIVKQGVKRWEAARAYEDDERQRALEDVEFCDGEDMQWTDQAKAARAGRPVMTFNKVAAARDQVLGDHLQSRPGIKVRPAEDGDKEIAEIYTGLIRNIEAQSNAKRAYKTAFKFACTGGIGAFRICHDYMEDGSFNDQELIVKEIPNPFGVYGDPMAEKPSKEDGNFFHVTQLMYREDFEEKYPKASAQASSYEAHGTLHDWFLDDTVRLTEYYRKVPMTRTRYKLSDGTIHEDDIEPILDELAEQGVTVVDQREYEDYKIEHFLMSGLDILEEYEYVGRYFPIILVYGRRLNINGRLSYRGIVRLAKDAQRSYNYERSNYIEHTALQPKQPYLVTTAMIEGHEDQWRNMNVRSDPYLGYNLDGGQGPRREQPGQPNNALLAGIQMSSDDIKATTQIHDASLGRKSNETSGKAIMERDRQGDTATYEFTDEFGEAMEYGAKVEVDLIPRIYDGERMARILGEDGSEKLVMINKKERDIQTGEEIIYNDMNQGRYDVVLTMGASYSTKRTETAAQLSQIMAQNPEMSKLFADIYVKSLDVLGADELVQRLRKIGIKEGYVTPTDEEKKEMAGDQKAQAAKQKQQEFQMRNAEAEVSLKEAQVKTENIKAFETASSAIMKQITAEVDQLDMALQTGNIQGQVSVMQRLKGMMSLVQQQQQPQPQQPQVQQPMPPMGVVR